MSRSIAVGPGLGGGLRAGFCAALWSGAALLVAPMAGAQDTASEQVPEPVLSATTPAPSLTLAQAIERALSVSPQQRIADKEVRVADRERDVVMSGLLPKLSADMSQTRQTINPAVLGFPLPLDELPSVIGPFSVFDARLHVSQKLLDLSRSSQVTGAGFALEAAKAQAEQNREQIAARVALTYIEVLSGEQSLASAQADLDLAEELLRLARDQRQAGIASGVDVARAESAVAQDRYAMAEVQTGVARARLELQRLASLPMDQAPTLEGSLNPPAEVALDAAAVLRRARSDRAELAVVEANLRQAEETRRAERLGHLPTLSVFADYGMSSRTPGNYDEDTYRYGAMIDLPIYEGGRGRAERAINEVRSEQLRLQLEDLRQQIEQDVRLALSTLTSTAEQVRAAFAARDLADRELALARDRFSNGVANNVDVVTAQAGLARSRAQVVRALAAYQQARVNLVSAQGHARDFRL